MRFHSTPQSALDGEITILAIIETIVSIAIYVGLGLYFGTFKYLAWAIVVAPLMLFRTEASAIWGLKVYELVTKKFADLLDYLDSSLPDLGKGEDLKLVFVGVPFTAMLALCGTIIRPLATIYWILRRPLHALRESPRNWLRQSLCTDFFHPPEIVPLESLQGANYRTTNFIEDKNEETLDDTRGFKIGTFASAANQIRREDGYKKALTVLAFSPLLVIGYLPALTYRVSFKATAIAYAPFIWVAHATLEVVTAKVRLERFTKGELEKVRRVISLFVVTILAAKIALVWGGWLEQSFIESKFPSKKLAEAVVMFGSWPWWQFTLLTDALLTFFLFFFADAALGRIDSPEAWKEERTLGTVSSLSFLRAALALITIGHFFFIALRVVAPKSLQAFL